MIKLLLYLWGIFVESIGETTGHAAQSVIYITPVAHFTNMI